MVRHARLLPTRSAQHRTFLLAIATAVATATALLGAPAMASASGVVVRGAAVSRAGTPDAVETPGSSGGGTGHAGVVSSEVTVPLRDGATLDARVAVPEGGGTYPLVVVPGTFAGDSLNASTLADKLATRGYVTLSYTERGFGASTGQVDAGGPKDVADVSDAITWALAHTPSDPKHVGLAAVSYGAGFLPIVAALDQRVTAVAMVSGWGDMWASRFPNDTGAYASNLALYMLATNAGKISPDADRFFQKALKGESGPWMKAWAAQRSPANYLPLLRKRPVPLYVSTSMNEMIWPDDQTIDFYQDYPGRKHLDVVPGDHATTEILMPWGSLGATWQAAFDWMDTYVAGRPTALAAGPAVRVGVRGPAGENAISSDLFSEYQWEQGSSLPVGVSRRTPLSRTTIRDGENLLLTNGLPMYQGEFEVLSGKPTTVPLALVDRAVTGIWRSSPGTSVQRLRGSIRAHLELTDNRPAGSVFVYALDQAPDGTTYVIGHKPYSWEGVAVPHGIDVVLGYQAYDLPAGHRLVFAVSTDDVLYHTRNTAGAQITIGAGSYVDVPLKS